jgi:hypothetical protein
MHLPEEAATQRVSIVVGLMPLLARFVLSLYGNMGEGVDCGGVASPLDPPLSRFVLA